MNTRVRLLATGLAAILLSTAACTTSGSAPSGPSGTTAPEQTLTWEHVPLPRTLGAVTLATSGDRLIVGAIAPTRPRPRLLVTDGTAPFTEVPLSPGSPYGFEARWFQVAAQAGRLDAIGGARGGAHGNYRWSTWTGTTASVAEQQQPFGVFGSYGAGDLAGIAYAGDSPVILGAWQSARTGQDIATWVRTGERWARQESTGTALASTPEELVTATAITSRGDGLLLSGSVTHLAQGSVSVTPAVWVAPGATGPWQRLDLPRAGTSGIAQVQAGSCHEHQCLLTGTTHDRLSVWMVTDDGATQPAGIPAVSVPEGASILAPVGPAGAEILVVPDRDSAVVVRHDGDDWRTANGPAGMPVAAAQQSGHLWVVTSDKEGNGTLWRAGLT